MEKSGFLQKKNITIRLLNNESKNKKIYIPNSDLQLKQKLISKWKNLFETFFTVEYDTFFQIEPTTPVNK